MESDKHAFFSTKPVIGMVHLLPLPGSPRFAGSLERVFDQAARDLEALERGGSDAAIVENFGDVPYTTRPELVTLLSMCSIAARLRERAGLPLGINVQFNSAEAEWDMALACGFEFIRVEAFVENRVGAFGTTMAVAPDLARLRARCPAPVMTFADISVKHSFPLVEQPIEASVDAAVEAGVDALVLTGAKTGSSPSLADAKEFKAIAGDVPVVLGSGANESNVGAFMELVDAVIVGSSIKVDGVVENPVDAERVARFVDAARG